MTAKDLTTIDNDRLTVLGQVANGLAAARAFDEFRTRKAANTLRRHDADLALFAEYLMHKGVSTSSAALAHTPDAWQGITWGLVDGFRLWMLGQGYAVSSVNVRLSTVKTYAKLAFQAGAIDATEHALIRTVSGYARKEVKHIDKARESGGVGTRKGAKKAEAVRISSEAAKLLKRDHDETPQGRRDALLMALLLDMGLRVGEVTGLRVGDIDLKAGMLHFYRPKVDKVQEHKLSPDVLKAARAYFKQGDAPLSPTAPLLRASLKSGQLVDEGMSERGITKRVKVLGESVGIQGLSAHDCRHFWATAAAKRVNLFQLQEAGGWTNLNVPRQYVEAAKIANDGFTWDED